MPNFPPPLHAGMHPVSLNPVPLNPGQLNHGVLNPGGPLDTSATAALMAAGYMNSINAMRPG